jgi:signal-transduction protein with cAMP-binding, CBS, and nucleotidyltransferase domain
MTSEVYTIDGLASVAEAMAAMQTHNCRHLSVMRGSRVVNFLSMRDVMNHELAQKTEELDQMRAYISGSA